MLVHTQIPLSRANWLTASEFSEVTSRLKKGISRKDITNLRDFLKRAPPITAARMSKEQAEMSLGAKVDRCLEPVCRLMGIKPLRLTLADGVQRYSYQKPLFAYLTSNSTVAVEKVFANYERETIDEDTFSAVFASLEHEHLEVSKVKTINSALASFVDWAQALLSYHVMVHPYRLRNKDSILSNIQPGKIVLGFAETVDDFMNQFYSFKAYLMRINFLPRDSHFAFNLSNITCTPTDRGESLLKTLPREAFNTIFSYLQLDEVLGINRLSSKVGKSVAEYWPVRAREQQLMIYKVQAVALESETLS